MTLTTDMGKTFDVAWAWAPVGDDDYLMFELADARPLAEIAADFENCARFHRTSELEQPAEVDYDGYTRIRSIVRQKRGRVQLTLMKEE